MSNLPTLEQIAEDPQVAAKLPFDVLDAILSKADETAKRAAAVKKAINGIVSDRLRDDIALAYKTKGQDTGTVHIFRDGMDIKIDRDKGVDWDQGKLAEIAKSIAESGEDVAEYIKVTYAVSEAKYKAWPGMIRKTFEPARTMTPGSDKVSMSPAEEQAAA